MPVAPALRLARLALAAVVIGAAIAALPAPANDGCLYPSPEESYGTSDLELWPYGLRCTNEGSTRDLFLGPSVAETLVVTVAVFALFLFAARRWDAAWARALASSLALLGLIGLIAHALGYPGLPMFAGILAWPLTYAIQRDWATSFAVAACVLPIWLFFDLANQAWIGIPLAVAAAVLVAPRVSGAPAGLARTPAPPR